MAHALSDLVRAVASLGQPGSDQTAVDGHARPDLNREARSGAPEVIYARGKQPDEIAGIADVFLTHNGRVIVSLIEPDVAESIAQRYPTHQILRYPRARILVIRRPDYQIPPGGSVGIITAGTSDISVAEQALVMAQEMGCAVRLTCDVGVAGIHRLVEPLHQLLDDDVDVIIVAAGMDGALPSVVAGLVDVPVIGLPTSTGYGFGGDGVAALMSMLQTCVPGLSVVNVDNGIGAGATAGLIANRAHRKKSS